MTTYFITGTDTDCGKTYVSCQLLDYFKRKNRQALALKPVASGCLKTKGQLQSEDVLNLQKYNSDPSCKINQWQFAPPVSPHIAAKDSAIHLSVAEIAAFCSNKRFAKYDPLLIEGAGGLMVPLNDQETWVDFLELTQIPVIVVVGMKLGCINHALLSDAVLKERKIKTVGWIANCLDNTMLALEENIATLTSKMQMPLLAKLAYQGTLKDSCIL
jgi:dethiobiotin synthetase